MKDWGPAVDEGRAGGQKDWRAERGSVATRYVHLSQVFPFRVFPARLSLLLPPAMDHIIDGWRPPKCSLCQLPLWWLPTWDEVNHEFCNAFAHYYHIRSRSDPAVAHWWFLSRSLPGHPKVLTEAMFNPLGWGIQKDYVPPPSWAQEAYRRGQRVF